MANISSEHLLPYEVTESPQKQGNLTGTPRIVHDCSADLFNYIQEWNREYLKGADIIADICNLKLSNLNKVISRNVIYPEGMQDHFDKLEDTYNNLVNIVEKLKIVWNHLEGVFKLNEMKKITTPIFITWKIEDYVALSKQICDMYDKQLELNLYIKENIGHSSCEENILLYRTLWIQQPYIDKLDVEIEAMLKETNLR